MSTYYDCCENIQAENASRIPEFLYTLMSMKLFAYLRFDARFAKLIITRSGVTEKYEAGEINPFIFNELRTSSLPVSISISGVYDDYGEDDIHAIRAYFESADEALFDNVSYRLSYTVDGSFPGTFAARKEADGSIFRGMVKARELPEIPAGDWKMTDYALDYYREKREGENLEGLAPLLLKLSKLSRDNNFNMDEFLNEDCVEYIFDDIPMSDNSDAEAYWQLWQEIDDAVKTGETWGLPMFMDRVSARSMTVDYDGKPIYLICE